MGSVAIAFMYLMGASSLVAGLGADGMAVVERFKVRGAGWAGHVAWFAYVHVVCVPPLVGIFTGGRSWLLLHSRSWLWCCCRCCCLLQCCLLFPIQSCAGYLL